MTFSVARLGISRETNKKEEILLITFAAPSHFSRRAWRGGKEIFCSVLPPAAATGEREFRAHTHTQNSHTESEELCVGTGGGGLNCRSNFARAPCYFLSSNLFKPLVLTKGHLFIMREPLHNVIICHYQACGARVANKWTSSPPAAHTRKTHSLGPDASARLISRAAPRPLCCLSPITLPSEFVK